MRGLSDPERKRALEVVSLLAFLRLKSSHSEDEIARKAGFGTAEMMHHQLELWEIPRWLAGGTTKEQTTKPERKARRGNGQQQELPLAAAAIPLFRQALESLSEQLEVLRTRKEYLQDGRYVTIDESYAPITWSRQGISDEDWKNLCQRFGKEPNSDKFTLWDARFVAPAGATQSPQEPLTKLIAVYVLAGLPLEQLLKTLHPAPETVDEAELMRHIEGVKTKNRGRDGKPRPQHIPGLKTKAAQVAKLIHGRTLRKGPPTGELSPQEQNIVWYWQQRIREGVADDQIYEELKEKRGLTKVKYARLRKFRLDALLHARGALRSRRPLWIAGQPGSTPPSAAPPLVGKRIHRRTPATPTDPVRQKPPPR
jgi:hypothetical protein